MDDFLETNRKLDVTMPRLRTVDQHVDFAARIGIGYLIVSVAWILISDRLVIWLLPPGDFADWVLSAKGVVFVSLTALVLYLIVHQYVRRLAGAREQLEAAWDQILVGWAVAMDARERTTGEHSQRVAKLTVLLAQEMKVDPKALHSIYRGALLHDIGKIGVPDSVLLHPGPLTDEQWVLMRKHPEIGMRILEPIEFLREAIDIPYCHHERWDGTGYPRGLHGTEIPLAARIFAVADVFDAVTSVRTYRTPMPAEDALALIWEGAGTQFDPAVVGAFDRLMRSQMRERSPQ